MEGDLKESCCKNFKSNEKKEWRKMKMKKRVFRRGSPSNDPGESDEIALRSIAVKI